MDNFFTFKASQGQLPFYFFQSTAPYNVDGPAITPVNLPLTVPWVQLPESCQTFEDIADTLCQAKNPTLVIASHGFNVSERSAVEFHEKARITINNDTRINAGNVVYIGYRWPSEKLVWQPLPSTLSALPLLGKGLLIGGLLLWIAASYAAINASLMPLTGILLAVPITIILLRLIVYFRDIYRATNYAVADIVNIVRSIDYFITQKPGAAPTVNLSFVAHSMGAFVVTNAVRMLSDLFDPKAVEESLAEACGKSSTSMSAHEASNWLEEASQEDVRAKVKVSGKLGNIFSLWSLVLVSPDIPAETLISGRSNYLASALRRFDEAYLFSNDGDEVLRQLSTIANAFSFPNLSWKRGFRLGNVSINGHSYGSNGPLNSLKQLRVGYCDIAQLSRANGAKGILFPKLFTYFECTNYIDDVGRGMQGMLTKAKRGTPAVKKMRIWEHAWLFLNAFRTVPNVHGGYFDGGFVCGLIYRLACIGAAGTGTPATDPALNQDCIIHQIKVLN